MKNMKIEINDEQPLNDVVNLVEDCGYKPLSITKRKPSYVIITPDGYYSVRHAKAVCNTTLQQLREMK